MPFGRTRTEQEARWERSHKGIDDHLELVSMGIAYHDECRLTDDQWHVLNDAMRQSAKTDFQNPTEDIVNFTRGGELEHWPEAEESESTAFTFVGNAAVRVRGTLMTLYKATGVNYIRTVAPCLPGEQPKYFAMVGGQDAVSLRHRLLLRASLNKPYPVKFDRRHLERRCKSAPKLRKSDTPMRKVKERRGLWIGTTKRVAQYMISSGCPGNVAYCGGAYLRDDAEPVKHLQPKVALTRMTPITYHDLSALRCGGAKMRDDVTHLQYDGEYPCVGCCECLGPHPGDSCKCSFATACTQEGCLCLNRSLTYLKACSHVDAEEESVCAECHSKKLCSIKY